jgi:hypothetical protein
MASAAATGCDRHSPPPRLKEAFLIGTFHDV